MLVIKIAIKRIYYSFIHVKNYIFTGINEFGNLSLGERGVLYERESSYTYHCTCNTHCYVFNLVVHGEYY